MKLLLKISICFFLVGCASYPKKNNLKEVSTTNTIYNPYFANPSQDYIYKANIEVYNNNFGGIFIVKKLGEQHHRIVFTTEMGNKLFDFTFNKDNFTVNYILEDLNKKILINILKKDFKVLITEKPEIKNTFYSNNQSVFETNIQGKKYYYYQKENLYKIVRANNKKEKAGFFFTEINANIAQQIEILHNNIKLKIKLKSISN